METVSDDELALMWQSIIRNGGLPDPSPDHDEGVGPDPGSHQARPQVRPRPAPSPGRPSPAGKGDGPSDRLDDFFESLEARMAEDREAFAQGNKAQPWDMKIDPKLRDLLGWVDDKGVYHPPDLANYCPPEPQPLPAANTPDDLNLYSSDSALSSGHPGEAGD